MEQQGGEIHEKNSRYRLKLYVTGTTPVSSRAVVNVRKLCDDYLSGRHDLEIIDIFQQPGMAKDLQIVAIPTLVREFPLPERRFIGDMSETARLVAGLDLKHIG